MAVAQAHETMMTVMLLDAPGQPLRAATKASSGVGPHARTPTSDGWSISS